MTMTSQWRLAIREMMKHTAINLRIRKHLQLNHVGPNQASKMDAMVSATALQPGTTKIADMMIQIGAPGGMMIGLRAIEVTAIAADRIRDIDKTRVVVEGKDDWRVIAYLADDEPLHKYIVRCGETYRNRCDCVLFPGGDV
jgi:hypothetical protein